MIERSILIPALIEEQMNLRGFLLRESLHGPNGEFCLFFTQYLQIFYSEDKVLKVEHRFKFIQTTNPEDIVEESAKIVDSLTASNKTVVRQYHFQETNMAPKNQFDRNVETIHKMLEGLSEGQKREKVIAFVSGFFTSKVEALFFIRKNFGCVLYGDLDSFDSQIRNAKVMSDIVGGWDRIDPINYIEPLCRDYEYRVSKYLQDQKKTPSNG